MTFQTCWNIFPGKGIQLGKQNKTKQKNNKNPSSPSPKEEDSPEPGQMNQVHEDCVTYCLSFARFIPE